METLGLKSGTRGQGKDKGRRVQTGEKIGSRGGMPLEQLMGEGVNEQVKGT